MTTEERLAKVERELGRARRRSRWLLAALALGLGVLALVWASAASAPKAEAQGAAGGNEIRANRFVVVDENGEERATLGMVGDGPLLRLLDEKGMARAILSESKEMEPIVLGGVVRLRAGGTTLSLHDDTGRGRLLLKVYKDGPRMSLSDEQGKTIWSAP